MRVVFAGTPPFAARALEAIVEGGHEVSLVLSQPDRPSGRGLKTRPSAVSEWAKKQGLACLHPLSLKAEDVHASLRAARADVMVVAAYGMLLPQSVLDIPPRGCLNIHASLLPRWRGAAPIHRAILAGDEQTGVCIMRMEAGLDTGPVMLEKRIPIATRDTTGTLTDKLAELGGQAIIEALAGLDELTPHPQDDSKATYAAKVSKAEARLDWSETAAIIDRRIRAFNPSPGAETLWGGQVLKIWDAHPVAGQGQPGQILDGGKDSLTVACSTGAIAIECLQRSGGRRVGVGEFLKGNPIAPGTRLGVS
jgi:methionyl-tRNA formyltransferase